VAAVPVGLLSALASSSRWAPVRGVILVRLLRIIPSMVVFYVCTGALLAGSAALWHVALFTGGAPSC